MSAATVVHIAVEQATFSFDKLYSYLWPETLGDPQIGVRVLVPFGGGNRTLVADAVVRQVLVKVIQVLRSNLGQLQVSDGVVDPRKHRAVALQSGGRKTGALLQFQYILCVIAEFLDLIDLITCLDGFLEFEGGGHGLPFHLLDAHTGTGRLPCDPAANLFSLPV